MLEQTILYHYLSAELNKYTYINFDNPTEICKILDYSKVIYGDYEFQVKSLEQMLSRRKTHKTDLLSKMYFMYEKFFKYLDINRIPILPLSTHKLAKYFTNIVTSATFLRQLVHLGALDYKDSTYHFGVAKNRCRTYYINLKLFKEASKYCKDNKIPPYLKVETMVEPLKRNLKVKLGKCRISLKDANERQISQALLKRYPFIKTLREEILENNQKYESPFFWDTCDFGFRYNAKHTHIVGIGFRVSNSLCNKTKEERAEILKELKIHNEDDVSASIYSFNKSLNQGFWREPCDMYEEIHRNIELDNKPPYDFKVRADIKTLSMRPFFGDSEADVFSKLNFGCKNCIKENSGTVIEEIHLLSEAIDKTVGPSWKSTIFAIESYVMFKIKQELMNKGLKVYQVYDCLYHNGNINLEDLLKKHFNTFYERYKDWILENKSKLKFREFNPKLGLNSRITNPIGLNSRITNTTTLVDSSNIFGNSSNSKVSMNSQKNDIESSLRSDSNHSNGNILNLKYNNINLKFKFKNSLSSNSYIISPLYKVFKNSKISVTNPIGLNSEILENPEEIPKIRVKSRKGVPKNASLW